MTKVRGRITGILLKLYYASDHDCRVRASATSGHPARGPPGVRGLQRRGGGRPARRGQVQASAGRRAGVETSIFLSRYYDFNELF